MVVRFAKREDLPAIHALVRELAIYEKAEEEFVASVADYERDLACGIFEALVAEHAGEVVGMALYYMAYSTWKGRMLYLEDFVVKASMRGQGIGEKLFRAFLAEAQKKGCRLVKWQVLDWNEPAIHFYKKFEAIFEKEWLNGKIFLSS